MHLQVEARRESDRLKHEEDIAQLQQMAEQAVEEAAKAAAAETEARMHAEAEAALAAEREAVAARLGSLGTDVDALSGVLSHDTAYKEASHKTHQLTAGVLTVRAALAGKATAAASALRTLPVLAQKLQDDMLIEAFRPLHGKGAEKMAKVATLPQLAERFEVVAAAGRTAALVPEDAPGMWGHALAGFTSFITFRAAETGHTTTSSVFQTAEASPPPASTSPASPLHLPLPRPSLRPSPPSASALLPLPSPLLNFPRPLPSQAALARGDLRHAVVAVRKLDGAPAAAASGWLSAAEERLLLEQILTVATAESTISTAALAPF